MQMIQAATAIANDGKMMKPYVVEKTVNPNTGEVSKTKPEVSGQPISSESAENVKDILETVITEEKGTGNKYYQLDGYSVAGKTGTAQIASSSGGYMQGRENYIFSFLGMAPKEDPKLVMYVVVDKPKLKLDENGAEPVSKIFKPVMKSSLQYLNIEPEKQKEAVITDLPDLTKMDREKGSVYLKERGLEPAFIGLGKKIIAQSPNEGETVIEGEKVILRTEGKITIPNMTGWSKRDVLKVAQLAELKINMVGNGYAVKQNLKPKSAIKPGDHLVVNFETQKEILNRKKKKKTEPEESPPLN